MATSAAFWALAAMARSHPFRWRERYRGGASSLAGGAGRFRAAAPARRSLPVRHHHFADCATVTHHVFTRDHALLERSIDIVEIDIGDEAINPRIDAGWLLPMHIAFAGIRSASTFKSAGPRA